jgi:hypothetical protein
MTRLRGDNFRPLVGHVIFSLSKLCIPNKHDTNIRSSGPDKTFVHPALHTLNSYNEVPPKFHNKDTEYLLLSEERIPVRKNLE